MLESPHAETFNVQKYREMALTAISQVHARGNVPIVCGGTNYYIEALLFSNVEGKASQGFDQARFEVEFDQLADQILGQENVNPNFAPLLQAFREKVPINDKQGIENEYESALCHALLAKVDPLMADYLHKNDIRKVINALFKKFKS